MSNRDRRHFAALGGLIAVLLLGGATEPKGALEGVGSPRQQQRAQDKTAASSGDAKAAPTTSPPKRQPVAQANESEASSDELASGKHSFAHDPLAWIGAWVFDPDNFSDFLMVLFTLALTVVAFKQHFLESRLATETADAVKIAKQSADAATKAANAMDARVHVVERPYLFPQFGDNDPLFDKRTKKDERTRPMVDIMWQNNGRTPAIFRCSNFQLFVGVELPQEPLYLEPPVVGETILPANGCDVPSIWKYTRADGVNWLLPAEIAEILSGKTNLFFFGFSEYGDVFDNIHTTGFGVQWVIQKGHKPFWSGTGGPRYKFRKTTYVQSDSPAHA